MRVRPLLLALVVVALFGATTDGQSRVSPGSMPSAERVTAEIKGTSPMDTAARQMGAFWQLRQIIETLAGPRHYRGQLTREELRLLGEYNLGYQQAAQPFAKLKGTPDGPKFYQMHTFYEVDDDFRNELIERFLPPALRAEYLRAKGISDAQWLARSEAARRERERVQAATKAGSPPQPAGTPAGPPNPYQREEQMLQSLLEGLLKGATELAGSLGTAAAPSSPAAKAAVEEFNKGKARYDAKEYPAAIDHFKKSNTISPSSAAYFYQGMAEFQRKGYTDALGAFTQVTQLVPKNPETRFWMGRTYFELKQYERGEAALREAVRLKAGYSDALLWLGLTLFAQNKKAEALEPLLEAVRLQPRDAEPLIVLGHVYLGLGRKADAMQAHQKAAAIDKAAAQNLLKAINAPAATASAPAPGTAEYLLREAYKYREAGDFPKAIESAKKALALNPSLSDGHLTIGFAYYQLEKYKDALPFLKEAVRLAPSDGSNLYWLGVNYFRLKEFQLALSTLQQAARVRPDDPHNHRWIGITYSHLGHYDQAVSAYRRAIELKPDYAVVYVELADSYRGLDEPAAAIKEIEQAIRLNPKEDDYRVRLAVAYLEMGRKEDATEIQLALQKSGSARSKELSEKIQAWFPDGKEDSDFLFLMGVLSYDDGRRREALPYFRRILVISRDPESLGAAHRWIGDVFDGEKKAIKATEAYERAAAEYQKAVSANPRDADLQLQLGLIFLKLGRNESATRVQRILVSLDKSKAQELLDEIKRRGGL